MWFYSEHYEYVVVRKTMLISNIPQQKYLIDLHAKQRNETTRVYKNLIRSTAAPTREPLGCASAGKAQSVDIVTVVSQRDRRQ